MTISEKSNIFLCFGQMTAGFHVGWGLPSLCSGSTLNTIFQSIFSCPSFLATAAVIMKGQRFFSVLALSFMRDDWLLMCSIYLQATFTACPNMLFEWILAGQVNSI